MVAQVEQAKQRFSTELRTVVSSINICCIHSNFAQNSEAICNLRIEKEKDNSQAINSESVTIANGAIVRKKEME